MKSLNEYFDPDSGRRLLRAGRFTRFLLAGAISFAVDLTVFQVAQSAIGLASFSFALAGIFGTVSSFMLSRYFVFHETRASPLIPQSLRFGAVVVVILLVNFLIGLVIDGSDLSLTETGLLVVRVSVLISMFLLKYALLLVAQFR